MSTLFSHVFTFNIRRVVHDLYARYERTRGQGGAEGLLLGSDLVVPPTPQQSTSSTSYDAVVPDITTFRPDKDDPLDIMSQPEDDDSNNHNKKRFKNKRSTDLRKRLELVSAIIATSISWNVSEAFENICSRTLTLQKHCCYENISFGLKG